YWGGHRLVRSRRRRRLDCLYHRGRYRPVYIRADHQKISTLTVITVKWGRPVRRARPGWSLFSFVPRHADAGYNKQEVGMNPGVEAPWLTRNTNIYLPVRDSGKSW